MKIPGRCSCAFKILLVLVWGFCGTGASASEGDSVRLTLPRAVLDPEDLHIGANGHIRYVKYGKEEFAIVIVNNGFASNTEYFEVGLYRRFSSRWTLRLVMNFRCNGKVESAFDEKAGVVDITQHSEVIEDPQASGKPVVREEISKLVSFYLDTLRN